ncbi:MAG: hypothetical protein HUU16_15830 [Candidatus Omnitrophica bacterium]|nr:hypothetical protein [Candidatus Omnitrophota bacterium]
MRGIPAILLFGLLLGCYAAKTPERNRPYESLNTIVSEVLLHRSDDTYRLPYPTDAEGKNLFSNATKRLDAWARSHPGQCEDIVAHAKGICHEKLGDVDAAEQAYSSVGGTDPDLPKVARKRSEVMADFRELFRPPLEGKDPEERLRLREAAKNRAETAIRKYKGTEWESLAWLLAENQAVAEFLDFQSRRGEVGEAAYREAIESLIERFPDSKRICEHWMRLALYHEEVARELVERAEYGGGQADWDLAKKALERATEIYVKISQADGYPEKREAQSRLDALEELAKKADQH